MARTPIASSALETWRRMCTRRLPSARARRARRSPASRSSRSTRPTTSTSTTRATSASPGEYPFTRGVQPTMYRGRLWTMRQFAGFGTAARDERALQVPARAGADRPLDRLRFPDADGLRLRPRRARSARSAAWASPSTRSTTWTTLFDGIPLDEVTTSMTINAPARDAARVLHRGRREAGHRRDDARRHHPERHPQGVHRAAGVDRPAAPVDAHRHRHDRVLRASRCRAGTRSRSAATTSARPARRRCRSSRSRSPTASPTSSGASSAGSTSTTSRRGSPSSSTSTTTSSRRSRSSARRAASGRAS